MVFYIERTCYKRLVSSVTNSPVRGLYSIPSLSLFIARLKRPHPIIFCQSGLAGVASTDADLEGCQGQNSLLDP